jgi:hypothetical protein
MAPESETRTLRWGGATPGTREPGFYWLRDLRKARETNPTIAYWTGGAWEFIGSDWTMADDDEDLDGVRFGDRFAVLDRVEFE